MRLAPLLILLTIAAAGAVGFQGDEKHLGNFTAGRIIPKLCWKSYLSGLVGASPVYSEGKVYVTNWYGWGDWSPGLYEINASTGEVRLINSSIYGASTPFIYGDLLVVGGMVSVGGWSFHGYLYIVNLTSGEVKSLLLDPTPTYYGIASSPIVYNGSIYVLTHSNGTLWKVSLDGKIVGRFTTGGEISPYTSPAAGGGLIVFAGNDSGQHRLYAVYENLTEAWNLSVDAKITNTPTIFDRNGWHIVFATEKSLYICNSTRLEIKPDCKTVGFNGTISSAAVAYGRIYLGSKEGKLYSFDLSGEKLWEFQANGKIDSSPAVADGVVYFATNTKYGTIYAVDAENGYELWHYRLIPPENAYYNIMSSPFLADGKLFIGADSGYVYCFEDSGVMEFNVTLIPGDISVLVGEKSYKVRRTTALGALYAASDYETDEAKIHFEITLNDDYYDPNVGGGLFVNSIMGIKPTPDWSRWWSIWNDTAPLSVSADLYQVSDGETIYYCYGSSIHGPTNSTIVLKIHVRVKPVGVSSFEAGNGMRAGNITAYVNVTAAKDGWFVVVVSGLSSDGDYIAGISTFHLKAGEEIRVPVLIHVPQRNSAGTYKLFAAVYEFGKYPNEFSHISEAVEVEVS
ncbi:MAG: PQQ-binding-like beta-propeller repeat protein [Archaeoglobaceae archaeon]